MGIDNQIFSLVVIIATCTSAQAKQVVISCNGSSDVYRSQFQATATLEVANDNSVNGTVSYSTQETIKDPFVSQSPVHVKGTLTVIPAGEMSTNEIDSVQITDSSGPLVAFALNTGTHNVLTSRLLIDRERGYVSGCEFNTH